MCVAAESTVAVVLQRISDNKMGVAFVIDQALRLIGSVTDGDIRRALLSGQLALDQPVTDVMNPEPHALAIGAGAEATYAALTAGVRGGRSVFPRVDASGRIRSFSYQADWGLVPIAEPVLKGNEASYVMECLESNWISSTGPYVERFEYAFSEFTGLANPVACSNGTTAITLALQALGLPSGAEVIVPDCTFAATANAVIAAGGRPVFADIDPTTWGLSPETASELIGPDTWGVIPVHLYGNPCDVAGLHRMCKERGLIMVEDCAEAIGTTVGDRHAGSLGDAATFSFFGNKTITTGEGGMVFFRDSAAAERARTLRAHGVSHTRRYWHEVVGYNYRMTNLQAAVGLAQTERADDLVNSKLRHAFRYRAGLGPVPGVSLMPMSPYGRCSFWLMPLLIDGDAERRYALMESLATAGIQTRETFPPLHRMPPFSVCRGADHFPVADHIADFGLCLPNNPGMSDEDIDITIATLAEFPVT